MFVFRTSTQWYMIHDSIFHIDSIFLIRDMNGKVGNGRIDGVLGGWGVPAVVDENGSALVDICAGKGLAIANTFFRHKLIHRYTWRVLRRTNGILNERKAMIDYVCVDGRMRRQVMDARAWRVWGNGISDHYLVVARIRVQKKWVRGRQRGQEGSAPVQKVERLNENEKREEYMRAVEEQLGKYELEQLRSVEGMNEVC